MLVLCWCFTFFIFTVSVKTVIFNTVKKSEHPIAAVDSAAALCSCHHGCLPVSADYHCSSVRLVLQCGSSGFAVWLPHCKAPAIMIACLLL